MFNQGPDVNGYQGRYHLGDAENYKQFNTAVRKVISLNKDLEEKENEDLTGAENIAPVLGLSDWNCKIDTSEVTKFDSTFSSCILM